MVDEGRKLYIGNLDPSMTPRDLEHPFSRFGHVANVWVARTPPGFAFVTFDDARDAADAVKEMDGQRIGSKHIRCELAKSEGRGGRGGRGGGFGGGGGGYGRSDWGRDGRDYRDGGGYGDRDRDRGYGGGRYDDRRRDSPDPSPRRRSPSYDRFPSSRGGGGGDRDGRDGRRDERDRERDMDRDRDSRRDYGGGRYDDRDDRGGKEVSRRTDAFDRAERSTTGDERERVNGYADDRGRY
uniref:RRM domain-containing protein n=1 Tax=Chromera velia CCMP2878 TaxID=1169474 RepID=A0A0G4F727_9ALVE|eukprot:Cvel_15547.t1-p1 / transcript=Cvel_15547.t1 / gene=Cvel_15547 / organism=Chromera_velia_CCMP2878 / gene_product=Probable splicing factor, arginine/serine-rich 6, putative / transcript_product=Probable splicing factor, arginine/serine-rich 6, putative / location=Cvel_scaffold1155:27473-32543(+) / protein_length=238 / sequence_SO=supercontig / SO=protein_coding / is_pseudo=false